MNNLGEYTNNESQSNYMKINLNIFLQQYYNQKLHFSYIYGNDMSISSFLKFDITFYYKQ